jgi:hypothetical protein
MASLYSDDVHLFVEAAELVAAARRAGQDIAAPERSSALDSRGRRDARSEQRTRCASAAVSRYSSSRVIRLSTTWPLRGCAALALATLLAVTPARADDAIPRGPIVVPGGVPNPGYCWSEVKLFDTLRYGPVDFCRKRSPIAPAASSAQVGESVCWVPSARSGRSRARR